MTGGYAIARPRTAPQPSEGAVEGDADEGALDVAVVVHAVVRPRQELPLRGRQMTA